MGKCYKYWFQVSKNNSKDQIKMGKVLISPNKLNLLLFIAVMIDPRCKIDYLIFDLLEFMVKIRLQLS